MNTSLNTIKRALKAYGELTCARAFLMHHCDGEGGRTVGIYLGLTTRQADAAINAGESFFREQHRIETESLTSSCDFDRYVRANRPNYA
jgi:hypothetical protein